MAEFFQTVMGAKFFDGTVPRVAKALERIAEALEKPALRVQGGAYLPDAGVQVQVQIADARALDRLAELFDGRVLSSSDIEECREILRGTGRRTRTP